MTDPEAEVAARVAVRCPCCEGYRDRGDGTQDHCGFCDDEGEVPPEKLVEWDAIERGDHEEDRDG